MKRQEYQIEASFAEYRKQVTRNSKVKLSFNEKVLILKAISRGKASDNIYNEVKTNYNKVDKITN